jgi:hypothetical protein
LDDCNIDNDKGEFLLAFAPRNVPIDKVFPIAAERGFEYEIVDDNEIEKLEHIYRFYKAAK